MDASFSDGSYWWHFLSIFIPKDRQGSIHNAAHLHIGNGNSDDGIPTMNQEWMQRNGNFCRNTKAVTAYLKTVPYQPIQFPDGQPPKTEDFIIGYTWRLFIEDPNEPNPDMVVLLPMAKAAKLALDTIHDFVKQQDSVYEITKFMPTGFSKRGWTTWLLACVDQRVFAMAPTVFDLLSMQSNLEHHNRAYGGWSWAFYPYWSENVTRYLYDDRTPQLATFIDPLSFNERLTMPKLIISASGDQFFLPDDANFFYSQLTGPTYLQIWENDDHGLGNHLDERDHNLQAFFLNAYQDLPFPDIRWSRSVTDISGRISLLVNPTPLTIKSWWADTTNITCEPFGDIEGVCRRDFRIRTLIADSGILWKDQPVYDLGGGEYVVAYDKGNFGYRGFFVEMTFPGPTGYTMRFTTEMVIIPDTYPFPKCVTEEECQGRLV
jgi:PhoPQ-activated pathogenicity-related protein